MAANDRVLTIIRLESEAATLTAHASEKNWRAAKLIWEEIRDGKIQKVLAKEIGKSEAHVTFMKKCWQLRVVDTGLTGYRFRDLGSFYEFYNSPEVRGESGRDEEGDRGDSGRKREPSGDYSAHGLTVQAYNAIDALTRNRSYHQLLTEEDLDLIRKLPAMIRALLRESSRR